MEHAYSLYVAQHQGDEDFDINKEISVKDLPLDSKNLTGTVVMNEDGKLEFKDITDGTYCSNGIIDNLSMIKGTCGDLQNNILRIKVNINQVTKDTISITVETKEGIPTSYSYEITGPNNYKYNKNNIKDNKYTFTDLKPGNYTITVIARNNKVSTQSQTTGTIEELSLEKPNINYTEELKTYTKGGKITIDYPNIADKNIEKVYRWNDWEDERFEEYTGEIEAKNETIMAIVRYKDTKELIVASDPKTIRNIDLEGPVFTTSIDGGDVTITASDQAGLHDLAYSCDGTWQESNVCIFTTDGNHTVNVRDTLENEGTEETVSITFEYHDISNASTPVLGNLTPVVYNGTNWVVADENSNWYNYSNQEWGNAVLLREDLEEPKEVGDPVTVEGDNPDAVAMFVWIPRFEYKIEGQYGTHADGTAGTKTLPGEIEVNFISKDTVYEGANSEGYRVHPAFWWDDNNNEERETEEELDGIWMGKFETTGTATNPTILPNVASLRRQTVSEQFETVQKFIVLGYDSHISKNSDWGAVAYLSQSKYGKYGNPKYTGEIGLEKEVRINNCSSYKTGIGANSQNEASTTTTCTTNTYETDNGMAASTTGNITGIYDMSGGTYESVMGVYNKSTKNSGFTTTTFPNSKYYDNYTNTPSSTACSSGICYGHALSETSGWYGDSNTFVSSTYPWFRRGGNYSNGASAGVFNFDNFAYSTSEYTDRSFRVVLSQTT